MDVFEGVYTSALQDGNVIADVGDALLFDRD